MKTIYLGKSDLKVPVVAAGCMRIDGLSDRELTVFIDNALEQGCNFFDHADIYGGGSCHKRFGEAVKAMGLKREDYILQSKCGIVPGKMFDFSKEKILGSVDGILKDLQTEYLDVLLLHRPDELFEPEEVAEAFDILQQSGKVRHFGVSNQRTMRIRLMQKYIHQPIVANQLQFSIMNASMISSSIETNMATPGAIDRDGSILDFCRLEDITVQAWSPFQYGFFEGVFLNNEKFPKVNRVIDELAEKYNVTNTTIASAWILRHPAKIQLISGTTKPGRFTEICQAADIRLTREEWYRIYMAAGNILP